MQGRSGCCCVGWEGWARTSDNAVNSRALYQLSYIPMYRVRFDLETEFFVVERVVGRITIGHDDRRRVVLTRRALALRGLYKNYRDAWKAM
jgi:hypothetical protein